MNTKLLSEKALSVIDQYLNFRVGSAVLSIPYFNNRHSQARMKLRVQVGKGSPKDILDELHDIAVAEKINLNSLDSSGLKKFLVDHNIGIDCSGLAYYILNAESESRGKGTLDRHLSFAVCHGILGKMMCKMRPAENAGVTTFAHEKNSHEMSIKDALPGDIITMVGDHNHILIIHQIEYQNFVPTALHYTHSMAWPEDGEYGHGIKQGIIKITAIDKKISEQKWNEGYTFERAGKSLTTLRRMAFL
ncbi:MAG: hypothetical protein Q8Q03_03245 [bacterium]|nr:hypothetical protein [bacterium]